MGGTTKALLGMFSTFTAFIFLVFSLLYTPCVAAVAAVKRELGGKGAVIVVILQCVIAWLVCFLIYGIGSLFGFS